MAKPDKIILSNQYAGYLFIDIVNVFAEQYNCELLTGQCDPIKVPVSPAVKLRKFIQYRKETTLKRLFTWLTYTLQVFFRLLFVSNKTELVLVTNPPLVPFLGYFFNRVKGVKYHLVIYDIYPDALVNFSFIKKDRPINKAWSKYNYGLFKHASTIYTLSDNMAEKIKSYNPDVKIEVIHNWSDTSHIRPVNKAQNPFAVKYEQVNKITVMYSGNMGDTHAVERIADLALAFKGNNSFGFLLIGEGAKKKLIEEMKAANDLHNLDILTYQKADVFPFSVACADIGIVTLASGAEDLSVPSKTYNLLAAGVALLVIASPLSELARLVKEYDCGIAFEPHETTKMVDFLKEMQTNYARLQEMKMNSRRASEDFTPENAKLYLTLLNSNVS